LVKSGAATQQDADKLVNDTLIPMIGNQQKIYENNMDIIDVSQSVTQSQSPSPLVRMRR